MGVDRMPPALSRSSLTLAGMDVPVIRVTGTAPGPRLTVLAGIHGCEYAPMAAVRQWIRQLADRDLRGTVVAAPVVNLPAFLARSPFVVPEDGRNLNRCFPGDPAGTLAQRLAHAVFTELIEGSDAVVDAHAGDLVEALEPFCLYDAGPAEARARDLAAAYGLGYVVRQEEGPDRAVGGTTSCAAAEIGIPAIIAEAGGCGLVTQDAVAAHLHGLNQVLAHIGMTGSEAALARVGQPGTGQPPVHLNRFVWLRSTQAGWWEPAVSTGQRVSRGQLLGRITSLDGERQLEAITAPDDGVPLFLTTSPAVAADGLLLGLGAR
jgi:predicted deacylase